MSLFGCEDICENTCMCNKFVYTSEALIIELEMLSLKSSCAYKQAYTTRYTISNKIKSRSRQWLD